MPDSSSDPIAGTDFDKLIDDETTTVDVKALSAFGYETRYRLVRLLVDADGAVRFDEITPYVSISDSAVSHALTLLCDAGLVGPLVVVAVPSVVDLAVPVLVFWNPHLTVFVGLVVAGLAAFATWGGFLVGPALLVTVAVVPDQVLGW